MAHNILNNTFQQAVNWTFRGFDVAGKNNILKYLFNWLSIEPWLIELHEHVRYPVGTWIEVFREMVETIKARSYYNLPHTMSLIRALIILIVVWNSKN